MGKKLDRSILELIKSQAHQKHVEYNKLNDVIGSQIFNILELNSRVLYYPLEDDDVWGFADKIKEQSFVCISTSIPYDKQVFAAAHELYHLWFNRGQELILSSALEEEDNINSQIDDTELRANRFAAEFLVEENLLCQEMKTYGIKRDNIGIKEILKLATLFLVPYKTMVRRLYEINIFKQSQERFGNISKEQIDSWRTRLGISLPIRENKIGLDNLVDKAMELYEKKLITIDKLEYLLSFADLSPIKLGVEEVPAYTLPTDEELQAILEE